MEALIFFLVICSTNLVFGDDNVAIESNVGYQVHAPPEENGPANDQQAEGSQIVTHAYGLNVAGGNLKDVQGPHEVTETLKFSDVGLLNRNGDVRYTYEVQNLEEKPQQQPAQYLHESIRHNPIVVNEGSAHSGSTQIYSHQEQQLGVPHYTANHVQLYTAQASPLKQTYENEHAIGYQTYVEHVPESDDEEIKSALKENSVGDLKRLVPKSGISFKIYQNEKIPTLKVTEHKVETQPDVLTLNVQATPGPFQNSLLHHRVKVQAPVQELQIQTTQTHQQAELKNPQQSYVQQNVGEHHNFGNQLTAGNVLHEEQNLKAQAYYTQHEVSSPRPVVYSQHQVSSPKPVVYTQPEISSPKPIVFIQSEISTPRPVLEITGKGTADPPYKIKIRDDHLRATSKAEFNINTGSSGHRQESNHLRHQQSRKNFNRTLKRKPENVQYQKELIEGVQKLTVPHNEGLGSFISHGESDLYVTGLKGSSNFIAHSAAPQDQLLHSKTLAETKTVQPILNRLSGSYITEGIKSGSVINHLGTGTYTESQYKSPQVNSGNTYSDHEAEKAHHIVTGPVHYATQFDPKSSPNNFDHQKALEGSTSFDIKNAIGNTDGTEHQTGYVSTTEIHPTEQVQKQQLALHLPSVPTVLIDNSILKTPIEGHQIKTFGQVTSIPQFAYHSQENGGKFYRHPQFVWTSEHFKQGNELHQPVIKLHLPKEEIQYVKSPKVEIPSIITHQHQAGLVHQSAPFRSQGLHFQHKKQPQGYQANLKLAQPVIIDWSLFKSKFPNVNINSLSTKPELLSYIQDPTKKIMPILVRKRKNRSNNKEVGVVYGKATNKGPAKPNQRQEKNIHVNLVPSASNDVNHYEAKGERKNEFSVSASYKVDRSYKSSS